MRFDRVIDHLTNAAADVAAHDREEGICSAMGEGLTFQKATAEYEKSNDRLEAVELIERAKRLLKRSWS